MPKPTYAVVMPYAACLIIALLMMTGCRRPGHERDPRLHFRILAPTIRQNSKIYLTGNTAELGGWNKPDALPLDLQPDGSWTTTLQYPAGTEINFSITRGTWQTMAIDSGGFAIRTTQLKLVHDTTYDIEVTNWRDKAGAVDRIFADSLGRPVETVLNSYWWRYHPGDSLGWASPEIDDGTWEPFGPDIVYQRWPKSGWTGIGWFRLRIVVDSVLHTMTKR